MTSFTHTIADPLGIHARPAALLVKTASAFRSSIVLRHGDKEISAKKMIALMSLGLKQGDKLEIRIEGEDEEQAGQAMKKILEEQL
ncbi:MAG: HPr family phosphocarrier protein [Bacteroidales bacterium]|jgi:phosphocarrier protein HPr|nr:HPr family phosphocarrier protein [Bacteroidales bacterium]NLV39245.1 HPr family phosphocarrier protein [Bacteroidales bacterium]HNZ80481.1 HPr family phosphocarrier protein [Bacteroidales bacterium]HOD26598.1 HPr family phosphocarrier protein [Bacteroidales bacterium]HOH24113.1 HPr family phosphocarrier protein [Bacteroidales bacterium]